MTILAQHGYGKGDKLHRGLAEGCVEGVIFSPRDENPANIAGIISNLRDEHPDATVFIDPQFYVSTIADPNARYLLDYPYFNSNLEYRNFVAPRDLSSYVTGCLEYQNSLDVTHICAPTVSFANFGDVWNAVAFSMAAEAVRVHGTRDRERPLLLSFVVDEHALLNDDAVDQFLDVVTSFESDGVYLLTRRAESVYTQEFEPRSLANLMYIAHVLSEANSLESHFGHTDLICTALHAAGATSCANGWFNNLRYFTFSRFEPALGGRRPLERYTSGPLLDVIKLAPDLDAVADIDYLNQVLSGTDYDDVLDVAQPSSAPWPAETSCLNHWAVCKKLCDDIASQGAISSRLDFFETLIEGSTDLFQEIADEDVTFDPPAGSRHLEQWSTATRSFRERIGV